MINNKVMTDRSAQIKNILEDTFSNMYFLLFALPITTACLSVVGIDTHIPPKSRSKLCFVFFIL